MALPDLFNGFGRKVLCPHRDAIQFCPLYIASHSAKGNECADDKIEDGRCAVDRGRLDYRRACARMQRQESELFDKVVQAGLAHRLGADKARH